MSHESMSERAEDFGKNLTDALQPLEDAAEQTCHSIRTEAGRALSCANSRIRANPLPAVAGAFAFGIAVGCLIMSGRSREDFHSHGLRESLDDAGKAMSHSLRSAYNNLRSR